MDERDQKIKQADDLQKMITEELGEIRFLRELCDAIPVDQKLTLFDRIMRENDLTDVWEFYYSEEEGR